MFLVLWGWGQLRLCQSHGTGKLRPACSALHVHGTPSQGEEGAPQPLGLGKAGWHKGSGSLRMVLNIIVDTAMEQRFHPCLGPATRSAEVCRLVAVNDDIVSSALIAGLQSASICRTGLCWH